MAEKKIEVVVKQGLKIEKKYPAIGTKIKIGQAEAERLLDLGVVALPVVAIKKEDSEESTGGDRDAELIAQIESAGSLEELEAMGIENPSEAVLAAAQKRAEELQGK
ncbi:MAG: hypothetical protein AB7U29_03485 [Desulfobulbus sp.]